MHTLKQNYKIIYLNIVSLVFLLFTFITLILSIKGLYEKFNFLFILIFIACAGAGFFILIQLSLKVFIKLYEKWHLPLLLFITVLTRSIWILLVNVIPKSDFNTYHIIAKALSNGSLLTDPSIPLKYAAVFPHILGYPFILAFLYKLFGTQVIIAQIFNILLQCGMVILIYKTGSKLKNNKCGFLAGLIFSVWPSMIFYTSLVLTDTLYTFLMLFIIYLFINTIDNDLKSIPHFYLKSALAGVILAAANTIRPIGVIVLIAFVIYLFVFYDKNAVENVKIKITGTIILLLVFFIAGKAVDTGIYKTIKIKPAQTAIGFNLYVGLNSDSGGKWNIPDSNMFSKIINNPENTPQDVQAEFLDLALKRFDGFLSVKTLKLIIDKHINMWGRDNAGLIYVKSAMNPEKSILALENSQKILSFISDLYYFLMAAFCLISVFFIYKKKKIDSIVLFMLIILGMAAVHMIVEAAPRYHYPAVSLFCIIAAYGIFEINEKRSPENA